jgi:hypothetical protein
LASKKKKCSTAFVCAVEQGSEEESVRRLRRVPSAGDHAAVREVEER